MSEKGSSSVLIFWFIVLAELMDCVIEAENESKSAPFFIATSVAFFCTSSSTIEEDKSKTTSDRISLLPP